MTTTTGGFALTNNQLESPPAHIPDGKGGAYKTELSLFRSPERTEKIIWWHSDDPRPEPHNHPWRFESTILSGGYTEDRWWIDDNGELQKDTITYRANDRNINVCEKNVYHVVRDVQPKTVTKLLCGQASVGNEWGYLDLSTKEYQKAETDPNFIKWLREINPHMRPKFSDMLNVEIKHYKPIVGTVSCVGIGRNTFPLKFGNYFWLSGGPYIVNFWAENLVEWSIRNPDVKTIEVTVVSDDNRSLGIITDSRMKDWLNDRLCVSGHGWPSMLVLRKVGEITGLDISNSFCGCERDNESPRLSHSFSINGPYKANCHHCGRTWQI